MSNFLTTLDLKVSECKDLPAKDILGRSDPYCLIKVDNHVIARTATVWNCLDPFWGEEYSFSLSSHHLQSLSVYIYDEDAHFGDDVIGKVTFSRQDMLSMNPAGGEVWYSLRQVDNASEVHGQLHLKILALHYSEKQTNISVKVLEARNLGMRQKYVSDPFVRISLRSKQEEPYQTRRRSDGASFKEQKRTSVRKTSCPIWNSSFELVCTTPLQEQYICAEVYDKEKIGQNFLIGEVLVDLDSIAVGEQVDQWYTLTPRESGKIKTDYKKKELGKIRLNVQLFEEQILPWECYVPLINLLVQTVKKQPFDDVNTLSLLEQVMTADRTAIGRALVKLYLNQGMIVKLLDALTKFEVVNTETLNTLFRGNSLATKAVDEFMKVIGIPYLLETLKPIIDKIYKEKRYCEIDPNKIDRTMPTRRLSIFQMDDISIQQKSVSYLKSYLVWILNSILESTNRCPYVLKQVFHNLYHTTAQRFKDNEEGGKYLAISSFLFLRFFVPAVLSPKLFGLAEHHPEQVVSRTLTLLAKVLQSIGNFNPGIVKEPWMLPFADFIKEYALKLKLFIDELVSMPLNDHSFAENEGSCFSETPLLIKEGQLKKCKTGGKLSNFQWKKYNFSLFNDSIHYSKKYDSQTRKFLLACRIIAVEKVEDSVFGKSNVFQIILDNPSDDGSRDIHYLLAKDVKEMNQWISAIRRILPSDGGGIREKCKKYHRGIFNGQFWNCCKRRSWKDPGCSLTHSMASVNDWQDPVFTEQQAQIIYKQFLLGRERLKDLLIDQLSEHNDLTDISKDEILNRISDVEGSLRVNSDSGCDTDNDDDRLLTCDLHVDNSSRTILNILSIVNTLEEKHAEYSLEHGSLEKRSPESEDEVFSSTSILTTPSVFSEIEETEFESTDTSVSQ